MPSHKAEDLDILQKELYSKAVHKRNFLSEILPPEFYKKVLRTRWCDLPDLVSNENLETQKVAQEARMLWVRWTQVVGELENLL